MNIKSFYFYLPSAETGATDLHLLQGLQRPLCVGLLPYADHGIEDEDSEDHQRLHIRRHRVVPRILQDLRSTLNPNTGSDDIGSMRETAGPTGRMVENGKQYLHCILLPIIHK